MKDLIYLAICAFKENKNRVYKATIKKVGKKKYEIRLVVGK